MSKKPEHIRNEVLIEQFQKGDKTALQILIKRLHPKLVSTITFHTRTKTPVEDIAQECWYAIIKKLGDPELKISFEAWALTIARRKSIDWIRNQQRTRKQSQALEEETKTSTTIRSELEQDEILTRVHSGILLLPPTQRIVLQMFYLENLSLREISKVLEIPKGTVKSRLFKAREGLKEIIK
jgi:RNA polymerase sigma-70 factor, ECF subfamily